MSRARILSKAGSENISTPVEALGLLLFRDLLGHRIVDGDEERRPLGASHGGPRGPPEGFA
eukprot:6834587-Pyramimonas_sp.AAC.1